MAFQQPALPYALGALAPRLSEEQMSFHFGKHHAAYFKNLNTLTEGKPEAEQSLEQLIATASGPIFNNAAQAWNHTFFWNCLSPAGGGAPTGKLAAAIDRDFGSFEAFKQKMSAATIGVFGSGWGWLAADKDGKLSIIGLSNAGNPLQQGHKPILTIDVWEHAYYVDYRNERPRFIENFWELANWDFIGQQYT